MRIKLVFMILWCLLFLSRTLDFLSTLGEYREIKAAESTFRGPGTGNLDNSSTALSDRRVEKSEAVWLGFGELALLGGLFASFWISQKVAVREAASPIIQ